MLYYEVERVTSVSFHLQINTLYASKNFDFPHINLSCLLTIRIPVLRRGQKFISKYAFADISHTWGRILIFYKIGSPTPYILY